MGKISVVLDDELEKRLRIEIAKRGGKKGDISKAIGEGVELWLRKA